MNSKQANVPTRQRANVPTFPRANVPTFPRANALPLLLFLTTAALSVWAAYDKQTAWAKFGYIAVGILLYLAFALWIAQDAAPDRRRRRTYRTHAAHATWLLAFFGAAVALYFLATHDWQQYPAKIAALTRLGQILQSPLPVLPGFIHRLHPNVVGGILAMLAPFAAAAAWFSAAARRPNATAVALALLALILFGLLLTTSRGAWIALGGATAVALLWQLTRWPARGRPARRRLYFAAALLFILLTAILLLIALPTAVPRLLATLPGLGGGLNRLDLYRNSLILVQDYPFIGAGLGGFMMLYSTYAFLIHVGYIIHAHNLYLDVAIEQGLFALLALLWTWGVFTVTLWRAAAGKRAAGRLNAPLAAAALALLTVALHGLVEDALYGSRAVILLFIPLAFAAPRWHVNTFQRSNVPTFQRSHVPTFPRSHVPTFPRSHVPTFQRSHVPTRQQPGLSLPQGANALFAALLLLIAAAALLLPAGRSALIANLAAVRQSRAELAVYTWPEWPLQDEVRRDLDLSDVIAGYERALALNPANVAANRRLGLIRLSLGDYTAALTHLERAYAAQPWDNATRQLYGEALLVNGRTAAGADLWRTVNNAQNQLAARVFWYDHIGDTARHAAIQESVSTLAR